MNRFVLATVLAGVALVPMWVSGGHRPAHAATLTIHHRFTAHVDVRGIREQTSRTPMLPRSRVKQTASGAVTSGTQLRLPASAFPSDSVKVNDEEKVAATADDTFFGQIHPSSYERLGMEGGWFEYYSSPVSDGVMDVVYLGSYYASSSQAKAALNDFANAPSTPSGFPCALGDQCIQYGLTIRFSDGDYQGYLRFVQQSNALAEMVSVVPAADFGKLASQTATNLNHVSTAFMSAIPATTATVTATPTVTATAVNAPTKTPTPTSTPKPTITPTATTIPTDVPVAFTVLSARTEKAGSAPDTGLKRAPVARVRVGTRVYESLYVLVQSAPTGANADYSVRITNRGKQVLQRSMTEPVAAGSSSPFRVYVSFKPARAGTYKVRWQVAVSSVNKTAANSLAVHT